MRYCRNFYCDQMGERICCSSCPWVRDCSNPCLNHPSRCGLEDKEKAEREGDAGRRGRRPLQENAGR